MIVTRTGSLARVRAASSPPKPAPMTTTRGSSRMVAPLVPMQSRNQGRASERYIDSCMREKSELFSSAESGEFEPLYSDATKAHIKRDLLEVALVFAFILVAVWTPQARVNSFFSIVAAACVVAFAIAGRWGAHEMGLTRPLVGALNILQIGRAHV